MAFLKKKNDVPVNQDEVLERILDELKGIRTEIRDSAVLGGTLANRGPLNTEGKLALTWIGVAQEFAEKSRG